MKQNRKFFRLLMILMSVATAFSFYGKNTRPFLVDARENKEQTSVEIEDIHGKVTVPVNPQKVVALDNRTFDSLIEWGVKPVAVPKDVMPADNAYVKDSSIENIGNHREPNLEMIAALQPDLVIVGQRFASYYDEIKELVPDAVVVDFSFDVSEEASEPGKALVEGLKQSTQALGKIFQKETEAQNLCEAFDLAVSQAQAAYNGKDKVMSLVVSGGDIGFAAPGFGRVWGPIYQVLNWQPALEVANESSDHKGDDISVEAIAQSKPDWLMVLDRDAAIQSNDEGAKPAKDVIEQSPALKDLQVVQEGHIYYAPKSTYTDESIQTFTQIFEEIAQLMGASLERN